MPPEFGDLLKPFTRSSGVLVLEICPVLLKFMPVVMSPTPTPVDLADDRLILEFCIIGFLRDSPEREAFAWVELGAGVRVSNLFGINLFVRGSVN